MLKSSYKMFKYIRKKGRITETSLSAKFPDFMELLHNNSCYYRKEDKNDEIFSEIETKLAQKTNELRMNATESSDYIHSHMPELSNNPELVTYEVTDKFLEFYEQKKEKLLLFWLPYSITTAIAIASLIAQFLT